MVHNCCLAYNNKNPLDTRKQPLKSVNLFLLIIFFVFLRLMINKNYKQKNFKVTVVLLNHTNIALKTLLVAWENGYINSLQQLALSTTPPSFLASVIFTILCFVRTVKEKLPHMVIYHRRQPSPVLLDKFLVHSHGILYWGPPWFNLVA